MKLRLIAQIVRIADGAPIGSINLDTGELATSNPELFTAWDRLRREGVRRGDHVESLSRSTLSHALVVLRTHGFDWRIDGTRKRRP